MQNRLYVPIFGCRKRTQRQAAYANPEEVEMLSSSNALADEQMCEIDFPTTTLQQQDFPDRSNNHNNNHAYQANKQPLHQNKTLNNQGHGFYQNNNSKMKFRNDYTQQKRKEAYLGKENDNYLDNQQACSFKSSRSIDLPNPVHTSTNNHFFGNRQRMNTSNRKRSDVLSDNFPVKKFKESPSMMKFNHLPNNSESTSNRLDEKPKVETIKSSRNGANNEVPRFLSVQIGNLQKWNKCLNDNNVVFELIGILDSAISYNIAGAEKKFTLKDSTGSIRCIFWEIDRKFPQLRRGNLIRCVGMYKETNVHCVSVRAVAPSEESLLKKVQNQCEVYLQNCVRSTMEI